jgi:transcriptional regulator with XRE-family HTH domain
MGAQPQAAELKGSVRLGNYLRRLRAGYGYSLRRVEERARAEGGEIDNSQLSRYEKGICYPSFDKLRVLASVFNVSVQAFSDVVDLEGYEDLKPTTEDPALLLEEGHEAVRTGDLGRAFACYERSLEVLTAAEDAADAAQRSEMMARARLSLAIALGRMGKLALAEQELRTALRQMQHATGPLRAQALLNLANLHADQGELLLAEMEAERSYAFARAEGLDLMAARAVHTLARVLADRGEFAPAVERYHEAAHLYERCADTYEAIRVRINIGGCFASMGKPREGIRLLRASLAEARFAGHRRLEAQAWSGLGEAHYRLADRERAYKCLRESDSIAGSAESKFPDLLFVNAFYTWRMAGEEQNPTREKIAFGRLKVLRSSLERRFAEVDAFDAFVERRRSDA